MNNAFAMSSQIRIWALKGKNIGIDYKGTKLNCGFRADLIVENKLLIELKAIERILPIHRDATVDLHETFRNRYWIDSELQHQGFERRNQKDGFVKSNSFFVISVSSVVNN